MGVWGGQTQEKMKQKGIWNNKWVGPILLLSLTFLEKPVIAHA